MASKKINIEPSFKNTEQYRFSEFVYTYKSMQINAVFRRNKEEIKSFTSCLWLLPAISSLTDTWLELLVISKLDTGKEEFDSDFLALYNLKGLYQNY